MCNAVLYCMDSTLQRLRAVCAATARLLFNRLLILNVKKIILIFKHFWNVHPGLVPLFTSKYDPGEPFDNPLLRYCHSNFPRRWPSSYLGFSETGNSIIWSAEAENVSGSDDHCGLRRWPFEMAIRSTSIQYQKEHTNYASLVTMEH